MLIFPLPLFPFILFLGSTDGVAPTVFNLGWNPWTKKYHRRK
jgi:hypothetical protein